MGQTINRGHGHGGEWESVVMESLSSPPATAVTMATAFQGKPPSVGGKEKKKKKSGTHFEIRKWSAMSHQTAFSGAAVPW